MIVTEFAQEVHENAKAHGWWETDRDINEIIALIHSEWSEALEEYRDRKPLEYRVCTGGIEMIDCDGHVLCFGVTETPEVCVQPVYKGCNCLDPKPEGIAVELIDGCIRILDLFGKFTYKPSCNVTTELIAKTKRYNPLLNGKTPLPTVVAALHSLTARAGDTFLGAQEYVKAGNQDALRAGLGPLEAALGVALYWIKENGKNPEKIMQEKHEYNKTRPYKHGKAC